MTTQLEHAPALAAPPTALAGPRFRPAYLAALLVATAVLYLWNITINGMGNQFYAAATQAGSRNWEALLFGSLDPQNFITVDKPPLSQWVMGLSGQLFGFSSASMLIPQALMAVAQINLAEVMLGHERDEGFDRANVERTRRLANVVGPLGRRLVRRGGVISFWENDLWFV